MEVRCSRIHQDHSKEDIFFMSKTDPVQPQRSIFSSHLFQCFSRHLPLSLAGLLLWAPAQAMFAAPGMDNPQDKLAPEVEHKIALVEGALAGRDQLAPEELLLAREPDGRLADDHIGATLSDLLIQVDERARLRLEIHLQGETSEARKAQLSALGVEIVEDYSRVSRDLGWSHTTLLAWVPHRRVGEVAHLGWVLKITGIRPGFADTGQFTSEGVELHGTQDSADAGIDGTGVSVGVISDGVANLADAVASGDLPNDVTVIDAGTGNEGTAMLEIVHDLAPGAGLLFHATGASVADHLNALLDLQSRGAHVITEDLAFLTEPVFARGQAVMTAETIAAGGTSVHSSSGNRATDHIARVRATGTGQGPDGNAGPFIGCTNDPANVVDIDPGAGTAFDLDLPGTGPNDSCFLVLQWSEPFPILPGDPEGAFTDLDLYVMDAAGTTCLLESLDTQGDGAGTPREILDCRTLPAGPVKVVVNRSGGGGAVADPLIDLRWSITGGGGATPLDPTDRLGSLNPDANYTGLASAVGAVRAGGPGGSTDRAVTQLETFSSSGPVTLEATTVCTGGNYPCPGNSEAGPPAVAGAGVAWTAADGTSVSGAGGFGQGTCPAAQNGDCLFFGTSAAAPHSAACDALARQFLTSQGQTPTVIQVRNLLAASAEPRGTAELWGAGVLDCRFAPPQLLVLLDRTGSMQITRPGTGNSRCRDAWELAKADVLDFATRNPGAAIAVWTFATTVDDLTGGFVDAPTAFAALTALDPEGCSGTTPLAQAMCEASDAMVAAFPDLSPASRTLAVSSDGGENASSGDCAGPSSASPPPYDPGSWQRKVTDKLVGQNVTQTRFWGTVNLRGVDPETGQPLSGGVSDEEFFRHLAEVTGGTFEDIRDDEPLPGDGTIEEIPTLAPWGLAAIASLLLLGGLFLLRQRRVASQPTRS
jgi:hypothetical protein